MKRNTEALIPLVTMGVAVALAMVVGPLGNHIVRSPAAGTLITTSDAELTVGTKVDNFTLANINPNDGRSAAVVGTPIKLDTFVIATMPILGGRLGVNLNATELLKENEGAGQGIPPASNVCDLKTTWRLCARAVAPGRKGTFPILSLPQTLTATANTVDSFRAGLFGATGPSAARSFGYRWQFTFRNPTAVLLANLPPTPIGVTARTPALSLGAMAEGVFNTPNSPVSTKFSVSRGTPKFCRQLFNP